MQSQARILSAQSMCRRIAMPLRCCVEVGDSIARILAFDTRIALRTVVSHGLKL